MRTNRPKKVLSRGLAFSLLLESHEWICHNNILYHFSYCPTLPSTLLIQYRPIQSLSTEQYQKHTMSVRTSTGPGHSPQDVQLRYLISGEGTNKPKTVLSRGLAFSLLLESHEWICHNNILYHFSYCPHLVHVFLC